MYLNVSFCIFMYLPDPGQKIQKDTFRYDVSFGIFGPRGGRYKKIHLDMTYLFVSFAPRQEDT